MSFAVRSSEILRTLALGSLTLVIGACAPKFNFTPSLDISKSCAPTGSYQLVFSTEPSPSIAAGAPLPAGGVVEAQDSCGNLVTTGALSSAAVALSDASQNGGIAGVTSVTLSGGIAAIPNNTLKFEKTGTTHLTAQASAAGYGTLSATSAPISIGATSFSSVSAFSGPNDPNGSVDGTGTASARFWAPSALASDGTNVYILENFPNCVMREYNIGTGAVTTLAGQLYNCGFTDGALGTNTLGGEFVNYGVQQMATDGVNVYFADGYAIRAVNIGSGAITTIAGKATASGYSDNSTGTSARLGSIGGLYLNGSTLYVGDNGESGSNCYIRSVDVGASPYAVSTVAGNGTCAEQDNASPLSAEVQNVDAFSADATNLYFSEGGKDIRQMAWTGNAIATDATGLNNSVCGGAGVGSTTVVGTTFYFSCQSLIEAATIGTWAWSRVAGRSWYGGETDGAIGTSLIGAYDLGGGIELFANGTDVYFTDTINGALRVLDNTNTVTTLAGAPNSGASWVQNASGSNSRYEELQDLVSDGTSLFGFDYGSNNSPVISMTDGSTGTALGSGLGWGLASSATQVLAYLSGKIYYMDPCQLFVIDPVADTISSVVGNDSNCVENEGGFATATFTGPSAIASDQQYLYIADNHAIKKLDMTAQTVSVLSGVAGTGGCTTGAASASRYGAPTYMTYMNGYLYFTEYCNGDQIIQVNTQTGASSVVAGNGTFGYQDGALANAQFGGAGYFYQSLPITNDGQALYVYDAPNGTIREVNIGGNSVTTLFGSTSERWDIDGSLANARESAFAGAGSNAIYYGYGKLYISNGRGVRVVH